MKEDEDFFNQLKSLESKYSFNQDEIYYFNTHRSSELVLYLQKRIEAFDEDVIPEIFKDFGEIDTYEVNKSFGTGHVIVFIKTKDGKKYVLRTNYAITEPEKYMDFEKYFVKQYESIGVHSPSIIHSDTTRKKYSFDYQIETMLDGHDLKSEKKVTEEEYEHISHQIGEVVAKQYKLPMKGFGRIVERDGEYQGYYNTHNEYLSAYLDHDLSVMVFFKIINKKDSDKILKFFTSQEIKNTFTDTQSYLIHHDLADHNIRVKDGKLIAIYDWENAVAFDPLCELGSAPTWPSPYPREPKMVEGFLKEYGKEPENFHLKIAIYRLRTMIWKIAFALKGKRLSARHIDLFLQSLKNCSLDINVNYEESI